MKTIPSTTTTPAVSSRRAARASPFKATSRPGERGNAKPSTPSRRPLGTISTSNLPSFASSLEQLQQQDVDTWYADVKRRALLSSSPSGSETDYKDEMIAALKRGVRLVAHAQELRPELFAECSCLIRALRTIIRLLDVHYSNEDWYDRPPPTSINQTLRRLKNNFQHLARSPSTAVLPAAQVTDFVHKFQLISKSMVSPA